MEEIKKRHIIAIGSLFSLGTTAINIVSNMSYYWQSLLLAFLISFIIYLFYFKLLKQYPGMNMFEIIKQKYNNLLGKILIIILLLILLYQGTKVVFLFIDFITTINQLDFISKNIIMLINFILLGYVLKNSLFKICRFTQMVFISVIIMIFLLLILGLEDINYSNLLPLYPIHENEFLKSFSIILVQPFCEITILFNVICKMKNLKEKEYIFYKVGLISFLLILVITIETVGILGYDYSIILNYPYYSAIASINMNKLVIRIESLSLMIIYFSAFVKLLFIVYTLVEGMNVYSNSKKKYYYPILLLIHVLSLIIYSNEGQVKEFVYYNSIFLLIITILLPIILRKKIINHST